MRVYLLSTYDEYGSEGMEGTADPKILDGMLWVRSMSGEVPAWADNPDKIAHYRLRCREWYEEAKSGLEKALAKVAAGDFQPGEPINLHHGWGGVQLHVIDLQVKPKTIPDSPK